ncbi:hypothetical protein SAMN05444401_0109 [Clostridium amylolyticum]|uniref:Uncharacterized protein n=1 Tax=Clostridium amylolyticum TaxID=1121298 RepID=A0A1M6N6E1_9CLOT|nr:hypothetical protein [Clostridium amylolyticum]SHJ91222.1 hypothetical protein SAMN05444401_0109 [Clostridium amylolyticum]
MKKSAIIYLILMALILGGIYNANNGVFKIDKSKISTVLYVYETDKNKMSQFNMTNNLSREDINSMVESMNNGVLKPDKNKTGKQTLEHIEMLALGDRWFSIYKQDDGKFTVMYQSYGSNSENSEKQITIDSEVLKSYFAEFRKLSKNLKPISTWDIKK